MTQLVRTLMHAAARLPFDHIVSAGLGLALGYAIGCPRPAPPIISVQHAGAVAFRAVFP